VRAGLRVPSVRRASGVGHRGPASERASAEGASPQRSDLVQLNILQTVVFSDHTHAVCMELSQEGSRLRSQGSSTIDRAEVMSHMP
jgi:hypothetical protein